MPSRLSNKKSANLPTIKCSCGTEILLVPDVKSMTRALEVHVEEHKDKVKKR